MDVVAVRKAEVLEAVARWLMQRPYWWEWVELRGVPEESSTLPLLREVLGRSGIDVTATADGVCPYIATIGDWSEYYAARRRVMRDVERQVRRLRRLGSLEWVMATRETARAHLEAVFHLHQQRQAMLGRLSKFSEEVHRDFCRTLLAICPWEWIDCSALRLNGEIIAAHFGFWYGGRFYYVTPAFDPAYATFSPGKVLLRYLVERCFADESVVECDLLEGAENYKWQWAHGERRGFRVEFCNPWIRARAGRAAFTAMRATKRWLARTVGRVGRRPGRGSGAGE
jgi:CelD/BcsL family acetyltransferase involved in cellulose biosynthesis